MKKINKNKKATNEVGMGIIAMALLLLLGGIFFSGDNSSIWENENGNNLNKNSDDFDYNNYLFFLNETEIGRQVKVTDSFPNVELGSEEFYNMIYNGNSFAISSNPFSKTYYSFVLPVENPREVENLLFYFKMKRTSGNQDLVIKINDKVMFKSKARDSEIPVNIPIRFTGNNTGNVTSVNLNVKIELEKPAFYNLFNWNKARFEEFRVVENRRNKDNNNREFSFQVDKKFLDKTYVNFVIDCNNKIGTSPVKVDVNGYTVANFLPKCTSKFNYVTKEVPLNILNENNNKLTLSTDGFYKIAYSFNKLYFNDKDIYYFDVKSFNDFYDAVIYGEFDKQIIDVKLNDYTFDLQSREMENVINYLRIGKNKLEILTKPVEIKELKIEKSIFYDD